MTCTEVANARARDREVTSLSPRGWFARVAVVGLTATVLVPGVQVEVWATPLTLLETLEDLPEADGTNPDVSRSEAVASPITFSAVGFEAPAGASEIRVRTSIDGETFSPWDVVAFMDVEDGPDGGSVEDAASSAGRHTEPLWVGEADHLQVEVAGASVTELETSLIDSMGLSGGPVQRQVAASTPEASATELDIIPRAQWGADESLGSSRVSIADEVHMGVVHHTAHASTAAANSYSRDQAAGLVRAFHRYHTTSLGWSDIGYNVLVDRFGRIYEGRKGGFHNGVVGAHASGFNAGSFGVSVIGNFIQTQASPEAIDALTDVIGVKSAIHGINPTGWTDKMKGTTWRPTIIGHKDVGQTTCPGLIQDLLPEIRHNAQGFEAPPPPEPPEPTLPNPFTDVPSSSPHLGAILTLADAGVATGCRSNQFCPGQGLSRAQASSFVLRAFELQPIPGKPFIDVDRDGAHTGAINALAERGWIRGYAGGRFGPWDQVTRGQLATLLANALGLPTPVPASDPYPDVSRTSTHAASIAALKSVGIQGNCGSGRFCANDIALRDSTASFVDMARTYRYGDS